MKMQKIIGKRLTNEQMQNVTGGAMFSCQCQDLRANPPYSPTWTEDYSGSLGFMQDDIDKRCVLGGSCTQGVSLGGGNGVIGGIGIGGIGGGAIHGAINKWTRY